MRKEQSGWNPVAIELSCLSHQELRFVWLENKT